MKKDPKKTVSGTIKPNRSKSVAKPTRTNGSMEKPFTKSQLISALAEKTAVSKQQVAEVFTHLQEVMAAHFKKTAPKQFVLPGLVKITVKHKPAVKARKGINPFTQAEMQFKAKPAHNVVRLRPLKALKDLV